MWNFTANTRIARIVVVKWKPDNVVNKKEEGVSVSCEVLKPQSNETPNTAAIAAYDIQKISVLTGKAMKDTMLATAKRQIEGREILPMSLDGLPVLLISILFLFVMLFILYLRYGDDFVLVGFKEGDDINTINKITNGIAIIEI